MARPGEDTASSRGRYGVFPANVAEHIYQSVVMGSPPPPSDLLMGDAAEHHVIEPYILHETLPPYDWWRAKNPDNDGEYFEENDFEDLTTANRYAPVYAKATKLVLYDAEDDKFPAYLKKTETPDDEIDDNEYLYVKNRDPNFFAMKDDIIWCIETVSSDIVPVSGGRKSIEGYTLNEAAEADTWQEKVTNVRHCEVRLVSRRDPNERVEVSDWTECVPNFYESIRIEKDRTCRIARSGGVWVWESIGCENITTPSVTPDPDLFGEFDSKARYEELRSAGYYSRELG